MKADFFWGGVKSGQTREKEIGEHPKKRELFKEGEDKQTEVITETTKSWYPLCLFVQCGVAAPAYVLRVIH